MRIRKEYLALIFIFLLGLVLRVYKFGDPVVGTDVAAFSRLGKNLIESGKYVFGENYNMGVFFPPGYPIFIGLINLFINDLFLSAKLISFIASLISIFLAYLIGKKLYNEESGLFAAFAFAVYPLIVILSVDGYSESLFFCFLLLSIYLFFISLRKENFLVYVLLGTSFGVTYLIRSEGLFLLLLPFLQLCGIFKTDSNIKRNKSLIKLSVIALIFVLIISPYLLFLKHYTGKLTLSGKSNIVLLLGKLSSGDRVYHEMVNMSGSLYEKTAFRLNETKDQLMGWDRTRNLSFSDYLFNDPINLIGKYQRNILQQVKILFKLLIPIVLPIFFAFFNRDLFKKNGLIFVLYPSFFFFIYPLFLIIERQTFLIVFFLILFSSIGYVNSASAFDSLLDFYDIKKNSITSFLTASIKPIIIFIFVLSSFSYLKFTTFDKSKNPGEHARAGYFLRNNVSSEYEKFNIMSRKPIVSFYSDSRFTMLPYANTRDVINFAKLYNVDYIVIDERLLSGWEFYDELIQMEKYSNGVELIYEDNSEKLIKLFKVKYK